MEGNMIMNDIKSNKLTFEVNMESNVTEKIDFEVINFEGWEAISAGYEFKLNLRSLQALNSTRLLGQRGTLIIEMAKPDLYNSKIAKYHGIIFEFSNIETTDHYHHYEVVLAPKLARLKYRQRSEIFVDSSLSEILNSVLGRDFTVEDREFAFKIEDDKYKKSSDDIYNRYNFVCQYEESDYNFFNRRLEYDGIYYYHEQCDTQEKLIITDTKHNFLKREENLHFRVLSSQSTVLDPDAVNYIKCKHAVVPAKVTIKNFGYEKSHLGDNGVISCSAIVGETENDDNLAFAGEKVIYGENFVNPDNNGDGEFLANIRAQEIYCRSRMYTAKSTVVPISAGMVISIEDGSNDEFNGEYLVVEVLHNGYQQQPGIDKISDHPFYENTLVLIPANVQFRPKRNTPWPRIYGTINALIDSDNSEDSVQLDDFGRYKIRLPFLKQEKEDGKGSIWMRLATPFAGHQYGFHFPLHKGVEVVLSFRDGNPDLPVIMSAVFNSEHTNVVVAKNSDLGGVILTKTGNALMMDDTPGKEGIGLRANGSWHTY